MYASIYPEKGHNPGQIGPGSALAGAAHRTC